MNKMPLLFNEIKTGAHDALLSGTHTNIGQFNEGDPARRSTRPRDGLRNAVAPSIKLGEN
jgi:hypothetical protein